MKFKSIKNASEAVLDGITIEFDKTDTTINMVILTDSKGNIVRVAVRSYSTYVEVLASPEMAKRFRVSGTFAGHTISEDFEHKYEAEGRKSDLDGMYRGESDFTITEVEVPVEG